MAKTVLSNSKSICVLAVVVCCFAILWPKIFLPMFQSALSLSGAHNDNQRSDTIMLPPKVRQAMKMSRPDHLKRLPGRPLQSEMNTNEMPRTGGLMGLVMPLYTIGIVVFFLYTILRMVFKNKSDKEEEIDLNEEESDKPVIKDFKMDPEYRKYILSDEYDGDGNRMKYYKNPKRKTNANKYIPKSEDVLNNYGKDKVTKALHILIRDMEEYKAKLLEVEKTKILISEVGPKDYKQNNSENVGPNETQKEENEKQNDLEEEEVEEVENSIENKENQENEEQMETQTNNDSENETNDENEDNEDTNPNPQEEYELKERLIENLESYYWESLLKGMHDLKHPKEE